MNRPCVHLVAIGLEPKSPEPYKLLRFYYLGENDQVRAEENLLLRFELDPYQIDVAGEYNHWLVPHNRH
ncbi:MAG: hypothetical protein J7K65_04915 [Planctomycetes bacterium]|nr:hypothetical protein [Planctomycetota bacterium]